MDINEILEAAKLQQQKEKEQQQQQEPTQEEKDAAAAKAVLTDEEKFEAELIKRYGVGSSGLIKKEEQIVVLSDEEKKKAQDKKESDILKWAFENGKFTAKEQEEYILAKGADKALEAKKLLANLGDDVAEDVDEIFKLNEEDELEDGDDKKPNKAKLAAKKILEKLGADDFEKKYGKFADLGKDYEAAVAKQKLKDTNKGIIEKSIAEIPKKMLIEADGEQYGFDLSDEDFAEVSKAALETNIDEKDLAPDTIKQTAATTLKVKHLQRIIKEVKDLAYAKGKAEGERGKHGVVPLRGDMPDDTVQKTEGHLLLEKIKQGT